ncbi:Npp1p [Sugiyamaella lignohabitans]|uniref:Npp1p n=1 Tax=Sugiyamaella lignohabitans TaxID=796027 RepID=A0A167CPG1_9ASCO|nr:Npp1p [Sugiyamaella lignohabitans]ANB11952.1 Npp1p [Sugiyamaella lignohabitans]
MASGYSLDIPRESLDGDDESDIVASGGPVTDRDRDLLRADDEVLKALAGSSSSKSRTTPNIKSLLPKKKFLSFATPKKSSRPSPGGDYASLGDGSFKDEDDGFDIDSDDNDNLQGTGSSSSGGGRNGNPGKPKRSFFGGHKLDTFRREGDISNADSDFSSEDDFDIEIDVETQPGKRKKRRSRNSQMTGRKHLLVFLLIILGFGLLYSIHGSDDDEDTQKSGGSKKPKYKKLVKSLQSNGTHEFYPTTVVISLDGFHPHYVSEELTPNLHSLFVDHSGVPYMIPSFPSSTFPNHWTLVTGLYPANHGIIGNTFFDTKTGKQFFNTKPGQSLQREWWGGEPIWETAALQGVSTAVHMWPGSEVDWEDVAPVAVDKFNKSEPLTSKTNRVFQWLDNGNYEQRPELILTYVPNVDTVGHQVGISGPEIRATLQEVDSFVGSILSGIKSRNLDSIVNVMVLSDHGMAPTSNDRIVFLEDLMDTNSIEHLDGWPLVGLRLKNPTSSNSQKGGGSLDDAVNKNIDSKESTKSLEQTIQSTYQSLKSKEDPSKFKVFLKDNMPREWNFGGMNSQYSSRIAPLWLVPQVGWSITTRKQLEDMGGRYQPFGVHGYNNTESLMRALFLATGPYFSQDQMFHPIPNVDVYNIICDTLNLVPAHTDGAPVRRALESLPSKWVDPQPYPGVEFHTEILKVNSTYDILFGGSGGSNQYKVKEPSKSSSATNPSSTSSTATGPASTSSLPENSEKPSFFGKVTDWWNSISTATSDALSSAKDWVSSKFSSADKGESR